MKWTKNMRVSDILCRSKKASCILYHSEQNNIIKEGENEEKNEI